MAESDVDSFRANLTDDFLSTLGDGATIGKEAFLERIGMGPGVDDITFDVVAIRELGDFALVHGITHYKLDGSRLQGVHDAWRRQGDSWSPCRQLTPVSRPRSGRSRRSGSRSTSRVARTRHRRTRGGHAIDALGANAG